MQESDEVREHRKAERKLFSERVKEAKIAVEDAIDVLEHRPRSYGGHLSKEATSTIDGCEPVVTALHQDGRLLQFVRFLDEIDTPYLTALVTYHGRWLVIPAYKLRTVG